MTLDSPAAVGENTALELASQAFGVDQLDDAGNAQVFVEEAVAAFRHFVKDVIDAVALVAEVAPHIVLVGRQLLVNGVQRLEIALEQGLALSDHLLVVGDQGSRDSDRVRELQAHTLPGIEKVENVLLQRFELTALPERGG